MRRNKAVEYTIVKRKVKYPRLEFKTGELIAIVPHDGDFDVPMFVKRHEDWIIGKERIIRAYQRKAPRTRKRFLEKDELRRMVDDLIERHARTIGVRPSGVCIRQMRSKWGSCSAAGNFCLNVLLGRLPDAMIDYVVYHELCHLRRRKHDRRFRMLLKKRFAHPEQMERRLFSYWFAVSHEGRIH